MVQVAKGCGRYYEKGVIVSVYAMFDFLGGI